MPDHTTYDADAQHYPILTDSTVKRVSPERAALHVILRDASAAIDDQDCDCGCSERSRAALLNIESLAQRALREGV